MVLDDEALRVVRDRITRVFRYLKALNEHRNPAVRQVREQLFSLWFHELPEHAVIRIAESDQFSGADTENAPGAPEDRGVTEDRFILRVRRPKLTPAPSPPEPIAQWLERGWDDPFEELQVAQSRTEPVSGDEAGGALFEDAPERIEQLARWKADRDDWAGAERPARQAMRVFETLYELYSRLEREGEQLDLVVGDGILSWRRPEGGVYHPVLLLRVQLTFDPSIPEFTVQETDSEVQLYSGLFSSTSEVDGRAIAQCRTELEEGYYHPLGGADTSDYLRRLVVRLAAHGEFNDDGAPSPESEHPCIGRSPVLFLRRRTLGFAAAIEGVLEDLQRRKDLPRPLIRVVGIEPGEGSGVEEEAVPPSRFEADDILFTKPANTEQADIAKRLRRHSGVLVQGPPGTGKTHTIANLLGHLLAQGQSVLVTAYTTKALRVLREQVVESLQPLCVSVLERDIESRQQLEASVQSIVDKLSRSDAEQLERQAHNLAAYRTKLRARREQQLSGLAEARGDEYRDVVVAGKGYHPCDAARRVADGKGRDDWIPGPVALGAPLPLSEGELTDLYGTNAALPPEDEHELAGPLPEPADIPVPDAFDVLVGERTRFDVPSLDLGKDLWESEPDEDEPEYFEQLADRCVSAVEMLRPGQSWEFASLDAARRGGADRQPWDRLLAMIDSVCEQAGRAQEPLLALDRKSVV